MELTVFDIFNDIKKEFFPRKTQTIVVAKPMCIPARTEVTKIFDQYGVKILNMKQSIQMVDFEDKKIPGLWLAKVTVSAKQAEWAEYLLLRSHKFMLWSKPLNAKNLEWADRHNVMPQSWNGKPLIEKNCKEGLQALKRKKK